MVKVRIAKETDAGRMLSIYAPVVLQTAVSFEYEVPSEESFVARINHCLQKFPWIVCEVDDRLAGYVYASTHREREAYQWTCECSVYLHEDFRGKGIGQSLYEILFEILAGQGFVNLYAGITLPNEASVKLHEKCGFEFFALYDNIGYKFNRWHKVGWWKRQLQKHTTDHPPPVMFSKLDHQKLIHRFDEAARRIQLNLTD